MRFVLSFIFLGLTLILSACTSGPSESEFSPKIGEIDTTITHHYSTNPEEYTIGFTVRVSVTDPDGLGDVTGIYIAIKNNSSYFILKDKSKLNSDDCFQEQAIIECSFHSKNPDEMNLAGYELVAVDFHGYESRKSFEFKLPGGAEVGDEVTVCTADSICGPPYEIEGLEAMSITNNNMVATLDDQNSSLHLEFDVTDPRVKKYSLLFYNDPTDNDPIEPKLIGKVAFDSAALSNAPIVFGDEDEFVRITVDISLDSIEIINGYNTSNIYGLHVVLLDQPTTSKLQQVTGQWFNYQGYSEFIPLAP